MSEPLNQELDKLQRNNQALRTEAILQSKVLEEERLLSAQRLERALRWQGQAERAQKELEAAKGLETALDRVKSDLHEARQELTTRTNDLDIERIENERLKRKLSEAVAQQAPAIGGLTPAENFERVRQERDDMAEEAKKWRDCANEEHKRAEDALEELASLRGGMRPDEREELQMLRCEVAGTWPYRNFAVAAYKWINELNLFNGDDETAKLVSTILVRISANTNKELWMAHKDLVKVVDGK